MAALILLALIWLLLHLGVAGTGLRHVLVARVGVNGFRGMFALAAIVVIVALCWAYARSPELLLWIAPAWLRWLLVLAMLPAFVLFVASLRGNPTAAGGEGLLQGDVQGIQRVTRHPMMVAFVIWAVVHTLGNGDVASLLFFGTFLITALAGMPSIDRKTLARDPAGWVRLENTTSIVPFAAIASGRNRFVAAEIGWVIPVIGAVVWLAMLDLHVRVFGVSPLPL